MQIGYFHGFRDGVDYVFVDHSSYQHFGGDIYGGSREDVTFRCALLCKAALEAPWHVPCGGAPYGDENLLFVANDWHTALLPFYLQVCCLWTVGHEVHKWEGACAASGFPSASMAGMLAAAVGDRLCCVAAQSGWQLRELDCGCLHEGQQDAHRRVCMAVSSTSSTLQGQAAHAADAVLDARCNAGLMHAPTRSLPAPYRQSYLTWGSLRRV